MLTPEEQRERELNTEEVCLKVPVYVAEHFAGMARWARTGIGATMIVDITDRLHNASKEDVRSWEEEL